MNYWLAQFEASSYSSAGSTKEKMIITEKEKELIENSDIEMTIDLPSGYYTCGNDDEYTLTKNDFYISKIDENTKNYLEKEDELDGYYIKEFIDLSNPNSIPFKIDKKEKEREEMYEKKSTLHTFRFLATNKLENIYGLDLEKLNKDYDEIIKKIEKTTKEIEKLKEMENGNK